MFHLQIAMARGFSRKIAQRRVPGPLVSFAFDDFPRSALAIAGSLLEENGFHGTYYAAMGLMGKNTEVGEIFHDEDLPTLVQRGHELACHTFDHISCREASPEAIREQCSRNRSCVSKALGGYKLRNFAFPFGKVSLKAKCTLAVDYETCRTVSLGINFDRIDLAYLRAFPVYSSRPIRQLKDLIDRNARRKGWAILYTHDVSRNPSPWGCTPEYFQEALSIVADSGATVLTVAEAVSRFEKHN